MLLRGSKPSTTNLNVRKRYTNKSEYWYLNGPLSFSLATHTQGILPDNVVNARELGSTNFRLDEVLKLNSKRLQFVWVELSESVGIESTPLTQMRITNGIVLCYAVDRSKHVHEILLYRVGLEIRHHGSEPSKNGSRLMVPSLLCNN